MRVARERDSSGSWARVFARVGRAAAVLALVGGLAAADATAQVPAPRQPDDEGGTEPLPPPPPPPDGAPRTGQVVQKAVASLAIAPTFVGDKAVISYTFSPTSDRELRDWVWAKRPERATLASAANVAEGHDGWDVGSGTNDFGKVHHKVEMEPPCSIDLDLYCWYNGPNSSFALTLCEPKSGQGLAVEWGRQLVRKQGKAVSGGGGPARKEMRAGRSYTIRVSVADGELTGSVNGVDVIKVKLGAKDLAPGKIGFEVHDARVIIRSITVEGIVSRAWAEKEAKKGK